MDKVKLNEFVTKVENHLPCTIISVRETRKSNSLWLSFNHVDWGCEQLSFSLKNCYDGISFNEKDIVSIAEENRTNSTIRLTLKNGEEYDIFLGEENQSKPKYAEIDIDDLIPKLKRSLATSIRFGEQAIYKTRAVYTSFSCSDIDYDEEFGDRCFRLEFANGEGYTTINIIECNTTIKLFEETDEGCVISLDLPDMPFATVMLFLNYQEITIKIPTFFAELKQ